MSWKKHMCFLYFCGGLTILFFFSPLAGHPVFGEKIILTQPDGTKITAYIFGDEYHQRIETEEGYTIVRKEREGTIEYALLVNDTLIPSGMVVGRVPPSYLELVNYPKHITDRRQKVEALRRENPEMFHDLTSFLRNQGNLSEPQALTGTKKILVICVEFQPEASPPTQWSSGTYSPGGFDARIFSSDPSVISVVNFYKASSYNQFWPEGYTYPSWVALPRTAGWYKENGTWRKIIEDAMDEIKKVNPDFDFTLYANNGELDLVLVWAGTRQTWATFYWPHAGGGGVSKYGIVLRRYTAVNERDSAGAENTSIGTFCHEYGHMTGSPDLYDYSSFQNRPVGYYCIMGTSLPKTHFCGYLKWKVYGWVTPMEIMRTGNYSVEALGLPSASIPRLYRLHIAIPKESLLIENRQSSADADYEDYPSRRNGLLITHIDENYSPAVGLPSYTFYGVEAIAPELNPAITTLSDYAKNWPRMAFSSDYGYDRLENTCPDDKPPGAYLTLKTGDDTENVIYRNTQGHVKSKEIAIRNISSSGLTMNFTAQVLAAPVHFTAEKVLNRSLFKVEYINILSWEANPDNENVTKYRIYLGEGTNPILLGETSTAEKKYLHRGVDKNRTYTYELVAVNDKNREGLPATLTVK